MKKKIAIILAGLMVVGMMGGCGSKANSQAESSDTQGTADSQKTEDTEEVKLSELDTSEYVTLGAYTGLEVSVDPVSEVTDEHVENYIKTTMLENYKEEVEVTDRAVETGDKVYYSCVGKMDGEVFDGGSSAEGEDWSTVIGSGTMIDGFEDGMIGMNIGETKDIECTFPDPYTSKPEYAGKDAVFTITVHSITIDQYPELTAELLTDMESEYATPEEARAGVRAMLEEAAQQEYEENVENAILSQILNASEFQDPPQSLIDQKAAAFRENMEGYASAYGIDFATYLSLAFNLTEEEFDTYAQQIGTAGAKQSIAIEAIADAEGMSQISDDELQAEAEDYIAQSSRYESVEDLYAAAGKDQFRDYVVTDRVLKWLTEHNTVAE